MFMMDHAFQPHFRGSYEMWRIGHMVWIDNVTDSANQIAVSNQIMSFCRILWNPLYKFEMIQRGVF